MKDVEELLIRCEEILKYYPDVRDMSDGTMELIRDLVNHIKSEIFEEVTFEEVLIARLAVELAPSFIPPADNKGQK